MARILIVDDAKFMRITLSTILKKANHEIVGEGE
ncbi:response regulator, partial [Bacillus sp. JJ1474]